MAALLRVPPWVCVTITRTEKSAKRRVSRRMLTTCAMPPTVVHIMTGDFTGTHRSYWIWPSPRCPQLDHIDPPIERAPCDTRVPGCQPLKKSFQPLTVDYE